MKAFYMFQHSNSVGEEGTIKYETNEGEVELWSVLQASIYHGCSERNIRTMLNEGKLIGIKISGVWLVQSDDTDILRTRLDGYPF